MSGAGDVLEVRDLKVYYYTLTGVVKAVDEVSLNVKEAEVLGIAGESGCGKSTLGYALLGLIPPPGRIAGGSVVLDGTDLTKLSEGELRKIRWSKVSMIFQGAMNVLNPVYTVGHQMSEPLIIHKGYTQKEALNVVSEALKQVGLNPEIVKRYPHELSGGMKQRVVIAMALLLKPKLVIADEPTTALDVVIQAQIINLLKKIKQEEKTSMIFITHDLSLISEIADKVAVMYAGKIAEVGPSEEIFYNPQHPYTQGLLKSIPRLRSKEKITWIPGVPPDLRRPPPGCRFYPRCPYAMDICRREEPKPIKVGDQHYVACWLHAKS
ncbi:MAG: dipeptide/oligopeptide/nickel ABC transporter ATP-binding protein [Zestosphaera tikiterensis]|uniref:Dipeptide/oligopeptide/nickel ABC transporter ATP-binding protein n=1 Tax=Zestosphaera tikiterensis TaxID=1973259 RepID=A0A2R7Y4K3_9CREN|nr:MAG: dipeptide/oligopeptide/nickel ABC transporter ATP-binding protein [Zestosphaera tikiterensis]